MSKVRQMKNLLRCSRQLPVLATALALAILAGVVLLTTLQVRKGIRNQIAGRDAEVLYAVARMHYDEDLAQGQAGPVEFATEALSVVLKSAELRGVLGVRLYDARGRFVESFPPYVLEKLLDANLIEQVAALKPVSRFHPRVEMWRIFYPDEGIENLEIIPLLEVIVPLHAQNAEQLDGIAQFLVEGHSIAAEFARLDRRLAVQAAVAFLAGSALLTLALAWAFHRVHLAQKLLAERTENLAHANQELLLASKTSALGAVTAHLLHGLKNPLAGLQTFVSSRGAADRLEETDWDQAVASTKRMQAMINQVVGVMREDENATNYDVTLTELEAMVRNRVQRLVRERGVQFASVQTDGVLSNRVANLVALILVNLCDNAIEATRRGGTVRLTFSRNESGLRFEVHDEGTGFPSDTPLFMPCRSTKEGGTGIGLALCKQLANHLGAELQLASSTPRGCAFVLNLPQSSSGTSQPGRFHQPQSKTSED